MMVVDTSALMTVILSEPEANSFADLMSKEQAVLPCSVLVEASIVAMNRGLERDLQELLTFLEPDVIALNEALSFAAIQAYRRYGKGRHKANLNLGDCFVYATAKSADLPLLFKGNDFTHTDVKRLGRPLKG